MAVCHHHAPAVMPFCIAGLPIVAVFQLGAAAGEKVSFWNQRDEFGDTNLLVVKLEEGRSHARTLGRQHAVLMNHHGATVVGGDPRELVSRSIFMCHNADYQLRAHLLGKAPTLTAGEIRLAGALNAMPRLPPRAARPKARPQAASGRRGTSTRTPARGQKMRKSRRTR